MHHLQANDSPESNGLAPQDVESMQSEETNASTDDQDFVVYNSSRISDPLEPRPIEEMMLRQSEHNYPDGLLLYRGAFIGTFEKSATQKHLHFIDNQQKISDLESGCPF